MGGARLHIYTHTLQVNRVFGAWLPTSCGLAGTHCHSGTLTHTHIASVAPSFPPSLAYSTSTPRTSLSLSINSQYHSYLPDCSYPTPFLSATYSYICSVYQTQPSSHTSIHIFRIDDNILIIY